MCHAAPGAKNTKTKFDVIYVDIRVYVSSFYIRLKACVTTGPHSTTAQCMSESTAIPVI